MPKRRWILCGTALVASATLAVGYTFTGYRWTGSKPVVPFYVSTSFESIGLPMDDVLLAINYSAERWNEQGDANIRLVYMGLTSADSVGNDGINLVRFDPGQCPFSGSCSGVAQYQVDGSVMYGFDITLYGLRGDGIPTNYSVYTVFGNQTSLPGVVLHELGHALGLGHSSAGGAMTAGGFGWIPSITSDDVAGLQALYGAYTNDGFWVDEPNPQPGEWVTLELDYPLGAGLPYEIFCSENGPLPGWPLSQVHAPMQPEDSRVLFVTPPFLDTSDPLAFEAFTGTLDANGRATARMLIGSTAVLSLGVLVRENATHHSSYTLPSGILEVGPPLQVYPYPNVPSPSFCDGTTLASCPCSPGALDSGCEIAQGTGGVRLDVVAQETSPQNRVTMTGTGFPLGAAPAVLVIRSGALNATPIPFGDGLRCVSSPIVRLAATFAQRGTSSHVFGHAAMAGSGDFHYQLWFRNQPASYCEADSFNLSNGRTLMW